MGRPFDSSGACIHLVSPLHKFAESNLNYLVELQTHGLRLLGDTLQLLVDVLFNSDADYRDLCHVQIMH